MSDFVLTAEYNCVNCHVYCKLRVYVHCVLG